MYSIEDLFDNRSIIGTRLELLLQEKGYTKKQLCEESGVSRPTINKLFAGTLSNKNNYEKHMNKIMHCLQLTPDMLLGNERCSKNQVRELRNFINISTQQMSAYTGISQERLNEIEAGAKASEAELRDIALVLSTSTSVLKDEYFFEPQISQMNYILEAGKKGIRQHISGFWGHIGILLKGRKSYMWYPITSETRKLILREANADRIVIPCMNNKVLLLHMENVDEMVLLDEACDSPADKNLDPHVNCGEIPLVIYEALSDYYYNSDDENLMSQKFRSILDEYIRKSNWTEENFYFLVSESVLYYTDGQERIANIDFEYSEELAQEVEEIYAYEMTEYERHILIYEDKNDGSEVLVNMGNIAMVEMPLLALEKAICAKEV